MCWLSEFSVLLNQPVGLVAVVDLADERARDLHLRPPLSFLLEVERHERRALVRLQFVSALAQVLVFFLQALYFFRQDDVRDEELARLLVPVALVDWESALSRTRIINETY